MQSFRNLQLPESFQVVVTADGSPSLEFFHSQQLHETMHHSGGALSESLYIYGEALEMAIANSWPLKVLSVGLGLGYNEILSAALSVKSNTALECLSSYESVDFLRESFQLWLQGEPSPLEPVYQYICDQCSNKFSLDPLLIPQRLRSMHMKKTFMLHKSLPLEDSPKSKYSVIFYDMFSKKMNEGYWQESFFEHFLEHWTEKNCVLSTYAATGSLNRALANSEFIKIDKAGFNGKRQSTLAYRGE